MDKIEKKKFLKNDLKQKKIKYEIQIKWDKMLKDEIKNKFNKEND